MPDLYLLFSHNLTEQQEKEAVEELQVDNIHYLPSDLQELWSQIPPELPGILAHIQPIKTWLAVQIRKGDYLLIQGDFGATYQMVQWALFNECIPIYATTGRKAVERVVNGQVTVTKLFEHIRFRLYE